MSSRKIRLFYSLVSRMQECRSTYNQHVYYSDVHARLRFLREWLTELSDAKFGAAVMLRTSFRHVVSDSKSITDIGGASPTHSLRGIISIDSFIGRRNIGYKYDDTVFNMNI